MQLRKQSLNFLEVGLQICKKEGMFALYKGLGAVITGIVPKMAIRFSSFQFYSNNLQKYPFSTFFAGLLAGVTEAVMVVTPMEVIKIRLQAQSHSLSDSLIRYRSPAHAAYTIVREEGFSALYKGVSLTALRQATNQAANFTTYQALKTYVQTIQNHELHPWQNLCLGGVAGAMGPIFNNPIDIVKTRIQRQKTITTSSNFQQFKLLFSEILKNEGLSAFYKGLTPRLLRVAPGNAVTFTVYEFIAKQIGRIKITLEEEEEIKQEDAY